MTVQELLVDETKWIQGSLANDSWGDSVHSLDSNACAWCLIGALEYCYTDKEAYNTAYAKLLKIIRRRQENVGNIADWNDENGRTFAEVRAVITSANI